MNTLIIKAHPNASGFTHSIGKAYKDKAIGKGREVRVIDLYSDTDYQQGFLKFENVKDQWSGQEARDLIQADISWADELVFIYPIWWSSIPAILKNFIDNNFTAGFAFRYSKRGLPLGLLEGKVVKMFATADGPPLIYLVNKPIIKYALGKSVFGFCGMKLKSFYIFTNISKKLKDSDPEMMLDKVRARV